MRFKTFLLIQIWAFFFNVWILTFIFNTFNLYTSYDSSCVITHFALGVIEMLSLFYSFILLDSGSKLNDNVY